MERPVLLDFDLLVGVTGRSLDCRRLLARVGEGASLVGENGRAGSLSSLCELVNLIAGRLSVMFRALLFL